LLDALLPDFEQRYNADVEVVAVGTGQALKLGENGDADVVLVHARKREDEFVTQGFGINRRDVMYNDFVIVGPESDPAQIATAANAAEAFSSIAARSATFTSRGDDSGTYSKEQALWSMAAITPTAELSWYKSLGQGMGETLITANELGAYTLTDRGTYLSMRDKLPNLRIWFGGEPLQKIPTIRCVIHMGLSRLILRSIKASTGIYRDSLLSGSHQLRCKSASGRSVSTHLVSHYFIRKPSNNEGAEIMGRSLHTLSGVPDNSLLGLR
jgi:hypothetical protein